VQIEQCFFHCAKATIPGTNETLCVNGTAFLRARLWKPETWTPHKIVFGKQFATKTGANDDVAKQIDEAIERDYRENL
jgi:hypothetical protein